MQLVKWTFRAQIIVLGIIAAIEGLSFGFYIALVSPLSIPFDIAKDAFGKIVDVDAALLGFTGVIVAVSMQNWKKRYYDFLLVLSMVVVLLLVSMIICFGELVVGTSIPSYVFIAALATPIIATTILFAGLGIAASSMPD